MTMLAENTSQTKSPGRKGGGLLPFRRNKGSNNTPNTTPVKEANNNPSVESRNPSDSSTPKKNKKKKLSLNAMNRLNGVSSPLNKKTSKPNNATLDMLQHVNQSLTEELTRTKEERDLAMVSLRRYLNHHGGDVVVDDDGFEMPLNESEKIQMKRRLGDMQMKLEQKEASISFFRVELVQVRGELEAEREEVQGLKTKNKGLKEMSERSLNSLKKMAAAVKEREEELHLLRHQKKLWEARSAPPVLTPIQENADQNDVDTLKSKPDSVISHDTDTTKTLEGYESPSLGSSGKSSCKSGVGFALNEECREGNVLSRTASDDGGFLYSVDDGSVISSLFDDKSTFNVTLDEATQDLLHEVDVLSVFYENITNNLPGEHSEYVGERFEHKTKVLKVGQKMPKDVPIIKNISKTEEVDSDILSEKLSLKEEKSVVSNFRDIKNVFTNKQEELTNVLIGMMDLLENETNKGSLKKMKSNRSRIDDISEEDHLGGEKMVLDSSLKDEADNLQSQLKDCKLIISHLEETNKDIMEKYIHMEREFQMKRKSTDLSSMNQEELTRKNEMLVNQLHARETIIEVFENAVASQNEVMTQLCAELEKLSEVEDLSPDIDERSSTSSNGSCSEDTSRDSKAHSLNSASSVSESKSHSGTMMREWSGSNSWDAVEVANDHVVSVQKEAATANEILNNSMSEESTSIEALGKVTNMANKSLRQMGKLLDREKLKSSKLQSLLSEKEYVIGAISSAIQEQQNIMQQLTEELIDMNYSSLREEFDPMDYLDISALGETLFAEGTEDLREKEMLVLKQLLTQKEDQIISLTELVEREGDHQNDEYSSAKNRVCVQCQENETALRELSDELKLVSGNLNESINKYNLDMEEQQKLLQVKDKELHSMSGRLSVELSMKETEKEVLQQLLDEKEAEIITLKDNGSGNEVAQVRLLLAEKEMEMKSLKDDLRGFSKKKEEMHVLQKSLVDSEKEINCLKEQLSNLSEKEEEISKLKKSLADREIEVNSLKTRSAELSIAADRVPELQNSLEEKEVELNLLKERLSRLSVKEKKIKELQKSMREKEDEVSFLNNRLVELSQREDEMTVLKQSLTHKEEVSYLKQNSSDLLKRKEMEFSGLKGCHAEIDIVKDKEILLLQESLKDKEAEVNALNIRLSELSIKVDELENVQQSLAEKEAEMSALNARLTEFAGKVQELALVQKSLVEKESEVHALNDRLSELIEKDEKILVLEKSFTDKEEELFALNDRLDELALAEKELISVKKSVAEKEAEVTVLKGKLSELTLKDDDIKNLQESLNEKNTEVNALNNRVAELAAKGDELGIVKTSLVEKEKEVEILNVQLTELSDKVEELGHIQQSLENKESEVDSLNSRLAELVGKDEELTLVQKSLARKEAEVHVLNDRLCELTKKDDEILVLQQSFSHKEEELYAVNNRLEELAFIEEELISVKKSLDEKEAEVNALNILLAESSETADELAKVQRTLSNKETEINILKHHLAEISSKEEQLLLVQKTLAEREAEINVLHDRLSVIKVKDDMIVKLRQSLKEEEEEVIALNARLDEVFVKDDEIKALRQSLLDKEEETKSLKNQVTELGVKDEEMLVLQQSFTDKEEEVNALNDRLTLLAVKEEEVKKLQHVLNATENELSSLKGCLAKLQMERNYLQKELDIMSQRNEQSLSKLQEQLIANEAKLKSAFEQLSRETQSKKLQIEVILKEKVELQNRLAIEVVAKTEMVEQYERKLAEVENQMVQLESTSTIMKQNIAKSLEAIENSNWSGEKKLLECSTRIHGIEALLASELHYRLKDKELTKEALANLQEVKEKVDNLLKDVNFEEIRSKKENEISTNGATNEYVTVVDMTLAISLQERSQDLVNLEYKLKKRLESFEADFKLMSGGEISFEDKRAVCQFKEDLANLLNVFKKSLNTLEDKVTEYMGSGGEDRHHKVKTLEIQLKEKDKALQLMRTQHAYQEQTMNRLSQELSSLRGIQSPRAAQSPRSFVSNFFNN